MADTYGGDYVPNDTIAPPDAASSMLGSGPSGGAAQQALLQALAQIKDLQTQPLVPNNPLAQMGSVLQGYASGYQGRANPAIEQAMAQRKMQTDLAVQQATIATHLAQMEDKRQQTADLRQQHKTDAVLKIAQPMMASEDPAQQQFGGQMFVDEMRRLGYQVPPDAAKAFGTKSLKPADINEIGKLMLPGVSFDELGRKTESPGMTPEAVAALTGRPVSQIKLIASMPDTEQWRSSIGAKTQAQLQTEQADASMKSQALLKQRFEWMHPEVNREVQAQVKLLFPGKFYAELNDEDQRKAVQAAENVALQRQNLHLDYSINAQLHKDMPAAQKDKYIDPNTYQPIKGPLSQADADANRLPSIDDPAVRRALPAMKQLSQTTQRVMDIVERHPEYWPPSQGSWIKDQFAIAQATATMKAKQKIDPDLGKLNALMADIPKLAQTAGVVGRFSNIIVELEKNAAGWDQVAIKENKQEQLQTTMRRMTQSITDLGLNPPPKFVRLPNGKEVWVPWNAQGGQ